MATTPERLKHADNAPIQPRNPPSPASTDRLSQEPASSQVTVGHGPGFIGGAELEERIFGLLGRPWHALASAKPGVPQGSEQVHRTQPLPLAAGRGQTAKDIQFSKIRESRDYLEKQQLIRTSAITTLLALTPDRSGRPTPKFGELSHLKRVDRALDRLESARKSLRDALARDLIQSAIDHPL